MLTSDPHALQEELGPLALPEGWAPRYNIAPSQPAAVLTNREPSRVRMHHFGLIPHWAKDRSTGYRMINARRETVGDKPAFRHAVRTRRCLVLADGFYEWQRTEDGKQPYVVRLRSHRPFTFAGLWSVWNPPEGGTAVPSCAIITAPATGGLAEIHPRMPVIVPAPLRDAWLHPEPRDPQALAPVLDATPVSDLERQPVSPHVSSAAHEGPQCIEPVGPAVSC